MSKAGSCVDATKNTTYRNVKSFCVRCWCTRKADDKVSVREEKYY